MIKFTVQPDGQSLIDNATAGISPVIIDGIIMYVGETAHKTLSLLSGSVYKDDSGIGEYCKISVEDLAYDSVYTATSIGLKSGSVVVAKSEPINIVKASGKGLKVELSCQFIGASKCSFNTIAIALPYATNFREGVIRIARDSDETQKINTVYSAQKIDDIVEEIISGGVDLSGYVNWDKVGTTVYHGNVTVKQIRVVDNLSSPSDIVTITLDNGKLNIDGLVTGSAVSSSPTISSGSVVGSDKLVNETYISNLYASEINQLNADKLVTSSAVATYVQNQLDDIDEDYVHIEGAETITGGKTFTGGIIANSTISGTGVQSVVENWNASANNSKLPTVLVVNSALNTMSTTITNLLQPQIDAINAGQNLADIVDQIGSLISYDVTNLKARGEGTITIGDKIQVLHDKTDSSGTVVPSYSGVATVYELVKGTKTSARDQTSTFDSDYYWHYIGEYGCDSYTKSESDDRFVIKEYLDQSISSSSTNTNAPTSLAVYNAIDDAVSDLEDIYVKLNSNTEQIITSHLLIKGTESSANTSVEIKNGYIHATGIFNPNWTGVNLNTDSVAIRFGSPGASYFLVQFKDTVSGSTHSTDINGVGVASYRDITGATLQDGRIVTVDYLNGITGNLSDYARLSQSNTFASNTTNTFGTVSATSYTGTGVYSSYSSSSWSTATTQIPTVSAIKSAIEDSKTSVLNTISNVNAVGSIGLFIYSEIGDELPIGSTVDGGYLKPAGISLPMSGQITYKSSSSVTLTGTWKLLSLAVKRTATEPCLVMAQKIS